MENCQASTCAVFSGAMSLPVHEVASSHGRCVNHLGFIHRVRLLRVSTSRVVRMTITPARQRNAVSEGAALGLLMHGVDRVSSGVGLSFAFEAAWDAWPDRYKRAFPQVTTDLRQGLNGYIAMTHADEDKHTRNFYWERATGLFTVRARARWTDGVDPEEAAESIDGDVPDGGWAMLGELVLADLAE